MDRGVSRILAFAGVRASLHHSICDRESNLHIRVTARLGRRRQGREGGIGVRPGGRRPECCEEQRTAQQPQHQGGGGKRRALMVSSASSRLAVAVRTAGPARAGVEPRGAFAKDFGCLLELSAARFRAHRRRAPRGASPYLRGRGR